MRTVVGLLVLVTSGVAGAQQPATPSPAVTPPPAEAPPPGVTPPAEAPPRALEPPPVEEAPPAEQLGRDLYRYGKQLKLQLTVFEVGQGFDDDALGEYSWAAVIDPWNRRGRLSLGAGRDDALSLRFDAKMQYEGGKTRTRVSIDLSVADQHLKVTLPDVHLRATSVYGETAFEATVPIIEGHF